VLWLDLRFYSTVIEDFRMFLDIDEVYRRLPLGMDNMNPDIIRRRKNVLEKYIQV